MSYIDFLDRVNALPQKTLKLPDGTKARPTSGSNEGDSANISKDGYELSQQILAAREQAAKESDAASRYQAALELGQDFSEYMDQNINYVAGDGRKRENDVVGLGTRRESQAFTTVSAQGTVVGVSYTAPHDSVRDPNYEVYTVQITRKDGFQLNVPFDDDMRINDLEDGSLSVYYASSGLTKTYDAEGRESIVEGESNALGTEANDIILNRSSSRVDAGGGDDTIISLAAETELYGGAGNDKIYVPTNTTRITIDGGAGDDAIVGNYLFNGNIVMEEGKDSLIASYAKDVSIISAGDDAVKVNVLRNSSFDSHDGVLHADFATIDNSNLDIDKIGNDFSANHINKVNLSISDGGVNFKAGGIQSSNIKFGEGDNIIESIFVTDSTIDLSSGNHSLNTSGIFNSSIQNNGGSLSVTSNGVSDSNIETQGGSAKVKVDFSVDSNFSSGSGDDTIYVRHADNSNINTGAGNDTIKIESGDRTVINAGDGNNTIWVGESGGSSVVAGSGNNNIWMGSAGDGARLNVATGETVLGANRGKPTWKSQAPTVDVSGMTMNALLEVMSEAQAANSATQSSNSERQSTVTRLSRLATAAYMRQHKEVA